jgi:hypothetical protein
VSEVGVGIVAAGVAKVSGFVVVVCFWLKVLAVVSFFLFLILDGFEICLFCAF